MFKDFGEKSGGWEGAQYTLYAVSGFDAPHSLQEITKGERLLGSVIWNQDPDLNVEMPIDKYGFVYFVALSDGFFFRAVKVNPPAVVRPGELFRFSIKPKDGRIQLL